MDIQIRKYRSTDRKYLVSLMEALQDYLVGIDPLHRLLRLSNYGDTYTDALLQKIQDSKGIIYLAQKQCEVVGCIAGAIATQSEEERVGVIPSKAGRILELMVMDEQRHQGIGAALMKRLENYFLKQHCDIVRVEVFVPNTIARNFYAKSQYADRSIDMIKRL